MVRIRGRVRVRIRVKSGLELRVWVRRMWFWCMENSQSRLVDIKLAKLLVYVLRVVFC